MTQTQIIKKQGFSGRKVVNFVNVVKKSDLENFEGYLDSYLRILKKFNKRISKKQEKKLTNLTFEIKHNIINNTYGNKTIINLPCNKNSKVFILSFQNILIKTNNLTTNKKSLIEIKSSVVKIIKIKNDSIHNLTNDSILVNVSKVIIRKNDSEKLNYSQQNLINKELFSERIKENVNNTNSLSRKIIENKKSNLSKLSKHIDNKKNMTSAHRNSDISINRTLSRKLNNSKSNKVVKENIEDKMYEKIKKTSEIDEEFLQKQKELINSGNNIFLNDNNDFNIYKKIINISLSLIVVGLLMGILLGLILVMYLNSRSSK